MSSEKVFWKCDHVDSNRKRLWFHGERRSNDGHSNTFSSRITFGCCVKPTVCVFWRHGFERSPICTRGVFFVELVKKYKNTFVAFRYNRANLFNRHSIDASVIQPGFMSHDAIVEWKIYTHARFDKFLQSLGMFDVRRFHGEGLWKSHGQVRKCPKTNKKTSPKHSRLFFFLRGGCYDTRAPVVKKPIEGITHTKAASNNGTIQADLVVSDVDVSAEAWIKSYRVHRLERSSSSYSLTSK